MANLDTPELPTAEQSVLRLRLTQSLGENVSENVTTGNELNLHCCQLWLAMLGTIDRL